MALQDILNKISNEAKKKAVLIKQVTDDEIKKIREEAQVKAEARKSEIEVKIEVQSTAVIKKSKTLATMESRSRTLKEKREVIDQAYKDFEKELNTLSSDEYLKLITQMLKHAIGSVPKGSLIVPSDRRELTKEAITKANADFDIKEEAGNFKGGFILTSGKIEINFSFPYLLQKIVQPATELEVAKILFP